MCGATATPKACAAARPLELQDTARPLPAFGVKTVTGFTGSSVWHSIYAFPPTTQAYWDKGFADFARRFLPILDVFEKQDINFALEVHPTEIAFDIASAQRAVEAVKGHRRFGFNFDPSHLGYQGVDYIKFLRLSRTASTTRT
jgi:sugar phosphate isomerase/epimerase